MHFLSGSCYHSFSTFLLPVPLLLLRHLPFHLPFLFHITFFIFFFLFSSYFSTPSSPLLFRFPYLIFPSPSPSSCPSPSLPCSPPFPWSYFTAVPTEYLLIFCLLNRKGELKSKTLNIKRSLKASGLKVFIFSSSFLSLLLSLCIYIHIFFGGGEGYLTTSWEVFCWEETNMKARTPAWNSPKDTQDESLKYATAKYSIRARNNKTLRCELMSFVMDFGRDQVRRVD